MLKRLLQLVEARYDSFPAGMKALDVVTSTWASS
jgi:hypothetical protein